MTQWVTLTSSKILNNSTIVPSESQNLYSLNSATIPTGTDHGTCDLVAIAAVPARARPVFAGLGFVDGQVASLKLLQVEGLDCLVPAGPHLHECEPAAPSGLTVRHHLRARHLPELLTQGGEVVRGCTEGQVPDVQLLQVIPSAAGIRPLTEIDRPRGKVPDRQTHERGQAYEPDHSSTN